MVRRGKRSIKRRYPKKHIQYLQKCKPDLLNHHNHNRHRRRRRPGRPRRPRRHRRRHRCHHRRIRRQDVRSSH